ncbi:MAG: hypothetical protein HRU50_10260 [Winogradskyella sp.]|uniref:hypothetical protein n=1 Tax=Winogradskyella sp. TaxID=1883156 RepID=UPI0025CDA37C|nr:hypothetical protein [Winogradskyella sp.]NRB60302.1 hypothetical protein [Winogradskyella sp.]
MERIIVSNKESFRTIIETNPISENKNYGRHILGTLLNYDQPNKNGVIIYDLEFDYKGFVGDFSQIIDQDIFHFLKLFIESKEPKIPLNRIYFENCVFKSGLSFKKSIEFSFLNCTFDSEITFQYLKVNGLYEFKNDTVFKEKVVFKSNNAKLYFKECTFEKELKAKDVTFDNKIRLHNCYFTEKTDFRNTKFKELADFWCSTFNKRTIFFKTDFYGTTVFSGVTFNENVLFTYSLIDKNLILKGTKPLKGFDLSLAIIAGELLLFDFNLSNFKSDTKSYVSQQDYDNDVSTIGKIPIKNKRETYRIIKNQLISQKNTIDATKFSYLESSTLRKEVFSKIFSFPNKKSFNRIGEWYQETKNKSKFTGVLKNGTIHILKAIYNWLSAIANYILLSLNRLSNRHGTSYVFGIIFTLIVGALFYCLSVTSTSKYEITYAFDWAIVKENISGYVQFLIPTHRFTYLNDIMKGHTLESGFYIWDVLGRIFIGYGIYQTIQAFRKYK